MRVRRQVCCLCFWCNKRAFEHHKLVDRQVWKSNGRRPTLFKICQSRLQIDFISGFEHPCTRHDSGLFRLLAKCFCKMISLWATHVWTASTAFGLHHGIHVHYQKQLLYLSSDVMHAAVWKVGRQTRKKTHKVSVKPSRPSVTNADTDTAFRHDYSRSFPKVKISQKNLFRSEVGWCDQTRVDLHLHRSSMCLSSRIATQKEPIPRSVKSEFTKSEFTLAVHLDIPDIDCSARSDSWFCPPRGHLITIVKTIG